jgi:acyl-CoA thioester hydrolase
LPRCGKIGQRIRGERLIEHSSNRPLGFAWQLRVYYQDTDAGGIVYHARYLDFMERARTEWLRVIGIDLPRLACEQERMFIAVAVTIDYLKSARLDDMLTVSSHPEKVARTYIDLNQNIFCGSTQVTRGRVRIACVNTKNMKPTRLPGEFSQSQ